MELQKKKKGKKKMKAAGWSLSPVELEHRNTEKKGEGWETKVEKERGREKTVILTLSYCQLWWEETWGGGLLRENRRSM